MLTQCRRDGLQAGRRQTVRCNFISGYNGSFKNTGVGYIASRIEKPTDKCKYKNRKSELKS
jgi:hypothetical protein